MNNPETTITRNGLLDEVHDRWLERTEGGDGRLIANELRGQLATDQPDADTCVGLLDGHIVLIAKEHVGNDRDEQTLYELGRQAVRHFVEAADNPGRFKLEDVFGEIEAAYEDDIDSGSETAVDFRPPRPPQAPPVRRVERPVHRSSTPRDKAEIVAEKRANLKLANDARRQRAAVKEGLRSGELQLAQALEDVRAKRIPIRVLLLSMHKIGPTRAKAVLRKAKVAPLSEVGALTDEEKDRLNAQLPANKYSRDERQATISSDESIKALREGNRKRIHQARLRQRLGAMDVTVAEILDDPIGNSMTVYKLLTALPMYGRPKKVYGETPGHAYVTVDKILEETDLSVDKRCDTLTARQRQQLLASLQKRGLA